MIEAIQFTTSDGRVTADRWPAEIEVAEEFLADASPAFIRTDGDRLIFTLANGEATYLRQEPAGRRNAWRYIRLHATGDVPLT